ncbi:hypothetical protein VTK56DRAFT_2250 [Thermocarpiscus australiensis]
MRGPTDRARLRAIEERISEQDTHIEYHHTSQAQNQYRNPPPLPNPLPLFSPAQPSWIPPPCQVASPLSAAMTTVLCILSEVRRRRVPLFRLCHTLALRFPGLTPLGDQRAGQAGLTDTGVSVQALMTAKKKGSFQSEQLKAGRGVSLLWRVLGSVTLVGDGERGVGGGRGCGVSDSVLFFCINTHCRSWVFLLLCFAQARMEDHRKKRNRAR